MRFLLLSALLAACSSTGPTRLDASTPPTASAPADTTLPGAVRTTTLDPQPIDLAVGDLPEPYATESVRMGPNVVAPPDDAVLGVPAGFSVQV